MKIYQQKLWLLTTLLVTISFNLRSQIEWGMANLCVNTEVSVVSSLPMPICNGEAVTFSLDNTTVIVTGWAVSDDLNFSAGNVIMHMNGLPSITFDNGFNQNVFIRAILSDDSMGMPNGSCDAVVTSIFSAQVLQPITENFISAEISSFDCETSGPITITGNLPNNNSSSNFYIWQMSSDQISWISVGSGSNAQNLTINNLPENQLYLRRIVNPAACEPDTSEVLHLQYTGFADGGNIAGAGAFCFSDSPVTTLVLSGQTGTVVHWEKATEGSGFQAIPQTQNLTQIAGPVEPGIYHYRVLVANGACDNTYSAAITVVVHAEVLNIVASADQEICPGQMPETIFALAPIGGGTYTSIYWEFMPASGGSWQTYNGGQQTETALQFTETLATSTYFRRVVETEVCPVSFSNPVLIEINNDINTGNFGGNEGQLLCAGELPEAITIENYDGTILNWYVSDSPSGPWAAIDHFAATYQPDPVYGQTYFRVLIQSGTCTPQFSSVYQLFVYPQISNNQIQSNQLICVGSPAAVIAGSFPLGGDGNYNIVWQQSADGANWTQASGIFTQQNYPPGTLDDSQYFRRIVFSAGCMSDTSNVVFIEVQQPPSGEIIGGGEICQGSTAPVEITLTGTPPFQIQIHDGNEVLTLDDIQTNYYNFSVLADEPMVITLISVSDAVCGINQEFAPVEVQINPIALPTGVFAGNDAQICGDEFLLSGLADNFADYIVQWTDEEGNVISGNQQHTVSVNQPGIYSYTFSLSDATCDAVISDTINITFDFPETAEAGNDIQVCADSVNLGAEAVVHGVGHWQIPSSLNIDDPFNPNALITGLQQNNTYSFLWIAESLFNVCISDSATVNVSVDQQSFAGFITGVPEAICEGEDISALLNGSIGEITQWLIEYPGSGNTETFNGPNLNIENVTESLNISAIAINGMCPADTSETVTVNTHSAPAGGILTADTLVCAGQNNGLIALSGYSGVVNSWHSSTDNFESSEILYNNQDVLAFENLIETTSYKVKVTSGVCPPAFSNIVSIHVIENNETDFNLNDIYCSSDQPVLLNELLVNSENGNWTINGASATVFNPSDFTGNSVFITNTGINNECSQPTTHETFIAESPEISLTGLSEICGQTAAFEAVVSAGEITWELPEELLLLNVISEEAIEIMALEYGNHGITVVADHLGCTTELNTGLTFYQLPDSSYAGPDQIIHIYNEAELNAWKPEWASGIWTAAHPEISFENPTSPSSKVIQLVHGENELYWTVSNGVCPTVTDTVALWFNPLRIPNAFSPNGDQVNDNFEIPGIEEISPVRFTALSSWGEVVFKSGDYKNEWDGKNKNGNDLPSGTYYFVLESEFIGQPIKGFLVLQR